MTDDFARPTNSNPTSRAPENTAQRLDALLAMAAAGGANAAAAARRAAGLADGADPVRAIRALRMAARLEPLDAAPRLALARVHAEQGDLDAACREAVAVRDGAVDQGARARAAYMLGEFARAGKDLRAARAAYQETLDIESALLNSDPQDPSAARWFARAKGRLAELDAGEQRWTDAKTGADAAIALLRAAAAQIGENPMLAADIADAELRRAAFCFETGEHRQARIRLGEAIGRFEALAAAEPDEPHWRAMLAEAWILSAEAALADAAPDAARESVNKAVAVRVKLAREDPHERWALIAAWRLRAGLYALSNDSEAARLSLAQARALCEGLCAETGDVNARTHFLIQILLEEAALEFRLGDLAKANIVAKQALERADAIGARAQSAIALDRRAAIAARAAQWDAAADFARRALEHRRALFAAAPNDKSAKRALAAALARVGETAIGAKDYALARRILQENFEWRLALAEAQPGDATAARDLALGLEQLGRLAAALGDSKGARAAWEEELALAERMFANDDDEGARFCAIVESLLASLGGTDAPDRRASALRRLDRLAEMGALTERDTALRAQLWGRT